MMSLLPTLLFVLTLLPQTITAATIPPGQYIPIGHGQCHDANSQHYPSLRMVPSSQLVKDEDGGSTTTEFQRFFALPRSTDHSNGGSGEDEYDNTNNNNNKESIEQTALEQLNHLTACPKRCQSLHHHPLYRGYELVIGRGCYCLMDSRAHAYKNNELGTSIEGDEQGVGMIQGSDGQDGYYCYKFIPDTDTERHYSQQGPMPAPPSSTMVAHHYTPTTSIQYQPIHLLVGHGHCHDNRHNSYPYILHSTNGSNTACKRYCDLSSPLPYYRGYENYPKEKLCACLYDTSSIHHHEGMSSSLLREGNGGDGPIVGVLKDEIGRDGRRGKGQVNCYKFYKMIERVLPKEDMGDAKMKVDVDGAESENGNNLEERENANENAEDDANNKEDVIMEWDDDDNYDEDIPDDGDLNGNPGENDEGNSNNQIHNTQAQQPEITNQANSPPSTAYLNLPKVQHISMGKGICLDSQSRTYIRTTYTTDNCEAYCLHMTVNQYYRGYGVARAEGVCECLFDAEVKNDKTMAHAVQHLVMEGGRGEIAGVAVTDRDYECFKYVGNTPNMEQSNKVEVVDEKSQEGKPSSSSSSLVNTYEYIGEGICTDSTGGWFDAVEYRNVAAADCQAKCLQFTNVPTYRGIEVTLSKVCFCLFDDGTHLDDAEVLNYGKGKGPVEGVQKKEGMTGPYCFKYTQVKSNDGTLSSDAEYDDDEIMKDRMLHDDSDGDKRSFSNQPSTIRKRNSFKDSKSFEPLTEAPPHTYNSLFVPHQTQYDFLRFDPYSFSGAPLGGWGRDTRNRLASLPIRLIHGFEGNWNDAKSARGDGVANKEEQNNADIDVKAEEDVAANEMEINPDGSQVLTTGNLHSEEGQTEKKVAKPTSSSPHFIIHDGTGQKYICRVYYDDELVVVSRMDSMFIPATTIEESDGSLVSVDVKNDPISDVKSSPKNSFNLKMQDGKTSIKVISETFDIDFDAEGASLSDVIGSAVANLLGNFGLDDIMAGLDDQNAGGAEDINAMLTQIGMAAAVGAGVDGANEAATSAGMMAKRTAAKKISPGEILDLLTTLKDVCSQLHKGWWSYEWCHGLNVKQFHVDVSQKKGAGVPGKQMFYEIKDVTLVGHFNGEIEIIYPAGNYEGEQDKLGTTTTITSDSHGNLLQSDVHVHTKEERDLWKLSHRDNEVIRRHSKGSIFEHRGPIIKQKFDHGDMCHEVGYPREMAVVMRCCTEDEMLQWMKSKTPDSNKKRALNKKDIPKAVLVSVEESKTEICHYTSQVCAPALCPDQSNAAAALTPKAEASVGATQQNERKDQVMNAIDIASEAIANKLADVVGNNLDVDDVQVFFGDEANTEFFEMMINEGASPSQVQALLNQFFTKKPGKTPPSLQMSEGESVRELLDRTLGKRPCMKKNLGWWTYEYCHNNHVIQYHGAEMIDTKTGQTFIKKETTHLLGLFKDSGNSIQDYPNEEEHLHVVNATGSSSELDLGRSRPKPRGGNGPNQKAAGGNGAVYVQEWSHGDTCDHEDVAESVIKGGNIVQGNVERSTTVRYSCGKKWELVDINEDSTCHYVIDISVPVLCQHPLFKAPVIKTQVVKCLPV